MENTLLETDGSNVTQVVYTLEPSGYGNLLSQRRGSTTSLYLFDALGSTRKLVNDSTGTVTDSYEFRAYGANAASSGSTTNVFRWVGELWYYYDINRLAYYLRRRPYSPALARFLSQDPSGFEGSQWNLFEYVGGTPTNHVDPFGLYHCPPRQSEIQSGEAIPIGDVDGDGKTDYTYRDSRLTGTGYSSYCYSSGIGMFYVRAPNGCFVHRCPYRRGRNKWSVDERGHFYSESEDPATGETICYLYYPPYPGVINTPHLKIRVYEKGGNYPIRCQTLNPGELPTTPGLLPMPSALPPCEQPKPPTNIVPVGPIQMR